MVQRGALIRTPVSTDLDEVKETKSDQSSSKRSIEQIYQVLNKCCTDDCSLYTTRLQHVPGFETIATGLRD